MYQFISITTSLPKHLWNALQATELSIFSQQGFHPL